MLPVLRRIVQEVNAAEDLGHALKIIVARVKETLEADVCSVYLNLPGSDQLSLLATDGLQPEAVGRVHLSYNEGLVGLVAQRAEPINLSEAHSHERFKYFPETGEERFHAFLGVPILHYRRVLGVVVVQHAAPRRFEEDHEAFLVTLAAQLAGAIVSAEITGELLAFNPSPGRAAARVTGIAGAPGIGIGRALVCFPEKDLFAVPDRVAQDVPKEIERFRAAVERVQTDLLAIKERMGSLLPAEDRMLFDAYMLILSSETLNRGTIDRIRQGTWAAGALRQTIEQSVADFQGMENDYLKERASDLKDLGQRILQQILRTEQNPKQSFPANTILIGHELAATHLADVPLEHLAGLICTSGSASSHVAILARALGVPTVMGAESLPVTRLDGREVIVDGYEGQIILQPGDEVRAEFARLAQEEKELDKSLLSSTQGDAITPDGVRISVMVNSGLMADFLSEKTIAADGIGLYRTEFPFMVRERFPGEDEQARIYARVLDLFPQKPVTLRTLDVGGDKPLSYFPIEEDNPFLGYRGIRISLDHPEIFLVQLRAMLKASRRHGNLQILFPMIGSVMELEEALSLLERAKTELFDEGITVPTPKVGAMIEVPAAIYLTEHLAAKVDFISVGTNDLVQYVLAVDRNNARVASLYNDKHPAVLCALKMIVEGAHRQGRSVSICGEMASDPVSIPLLLGVGVDSLSVSLASLPRVKHTIHHFSCDTARDLFNHALKIDDPREIAHLLEAAMVAHGLGALVRAGKS